jgi:hypothetical protein
MQWQGRTRSIQLCVIFGLCSILSTSTVTDFL